MFTIVLNLTSKRKITTDRFVVPSSLTIELPTHRPSFVPPESIDIENK